MGTPTPNLGLSRPDFDASPWDALVNANFLTIDGAIYASTGMNEIAGVWANSLAITVGQRYIDTVDATVWQCDVAHTTAVSGSFATDRANNPTYWHRIGAGWSVRGEWANAAYYSVGDIAYNSC